MVLSLACILGATLTPAGTEFQPDFIGCIICGARGWSDAIANVLLYAPLGAALAWNGRVGLRSVGYAFLLSACIELAQVVIPGRDPSLGDVTFNTLGAATGQLAVWLSRWWLLPDARSAARLSLVAAVVAASFFALTGISYAPALSTRTLDLWFEPALPELSWYHAHVLSTRLDTLRLHAGEVADRARVQRLLETGAPLEILAIAGSPVPNFGPMLAFETDWGTQLYLVGPDGDDLVLRYRAYAAVRGLDQPDIRLRGAFAAIRSGDTIRVRIQRTGAGFCLSLNAQDRCGLGHTIGAAWAMVLYPRHWPPWSYALLGILWVGGLALPVGFWTRWRAESLIAIALFVAAAALVPSRVALLATPLREWGGAVLGWGIGCALQIGLQRRAGSSGMGS